MSFRIFYCAFSIFLVFSGSRVVASDIAIKNQRSYDEFMLEARAHYIAGNYQKSIKKYLKARSLITHAPSLYSAIDNHVGKAYAQIGRYNESLSFLNSALNSLDGVKGEHDLRCTALLSIAEFHILLGMGQEVYEYFILAYKKAKISGNPYLRLVTELGLFRLFVDLNMFSKPLLERKDLKIGSMEQLLDILENVKHYIDDNRHNSRIIELSVLLSEANGDLYRRRLQFKNALNEYKKSLQNGKNVAFYLRHRIINKIAFCYHKIGQYKISASVIEELIPFVHYRSGLSLLKSYSILGNNYSKLENLGKANLFYQKGMDIYENLVLGLSPLPGRIKYFFTDQVGYLFSNYVFSLVDQGKITKALEIAQILKSRAMLSLMGRNQKSTRLAIKNYFGSQETIQRLNIPIGMTEGNILEYGKNFFIPPASVNEYIEYAKNWNTFILEYFSPVMAEKIFVWLTTPEGQIFGKLLNKPSQELKSIITKLPYIQSAQDVKIFAKRGIIVSKQKNQERIRNELGSELIPTTFVSKLNSSKTDRLIVIPDGEMSKIPFSILKIRFDDKDIFLAEKYQIGYAPSLAVLLQIECSMPAKHSKSKDKSYVFGNPIMPPIYLSMFPGDRVTRSSPIKLSSLPGAEVEASNVAIFIGAFEFTKNRASERRLKQLKQASIIHLATHGFYNTLVPENSFVVLSHDSFENGVLDLEEIIETNISCNLVTLSACQTGVGYVTFDSVIGLAEGFLISGSSAVLSSFWSVEDTATQRLMQEFYFNYKKGFSLAKSLQLAQITIMNQRKYENPFYWGAFKITGVGFQTKNKTIEDLRIRNLKSLPQRIQRVLW